MLDYSVLSNDDSRPARDRQELSLVVVVSRSLIGIRC